MVVAWPDGSNARHKTPAPGSAALPLDAQGTLEVRVLTAPHAVWALRPAWDALWRRADGNYAQASATCVSAWQHVAMPRGGRLHVLACFERGALVAIWPLFRRRQGAWQVLYQLGPMAAEFSDILAEDIPGREARVAAIWRSVLTRSRADMIMLPFVKADTPLGILLAASDLTRTAQPDIAPYVPSHPPHSWEQYYASLSASGRKVQNKKRRQLQALGELRFEIVDDPRLLPDLIRWLLREKRIWGDRVGKHGPWLASGDYEQFLIQLATERAVGTGFVFVLTLDGVPVAAQFAIEGECHIDWIIAGFSAAMAGHSPGMVLNEYCLRYAIDHALRVEMGAGREHNKLFWSGDSAHATRNYRIALTRFGVPGLWLSNAKIAAVAWAKRQLQRPHAVKDSPAGISVPSIRSTSSSPR